MTDLLRPRAVVVVAYGAISLLQGALEPLGDEHVVVVDNSSAAATRALVEGLGHTYLDAGANLGFAGGVNVGLRHLQTAGEMPDVLLLNPDARIDPDALDRLQTALLATDDLAAVAPSLVGPDGVPHLTWYPLPSPSQMWRFAARLPARHDQRDFLIGAALLLRAEAINGVGLFDERYFLYGEEADWQRRAFELGWRVAQVGEAAAIHYGGGSAEDAAARIARVTAGQDLYVRQWYGAAGSASFRVGGWVATVPRAASWPDARHMSRCFRLGPRRVAPLPPFPRALLVLHLVEPGQVPRPWVDSQRAEGHQVTVAEGRREAMGQLRSAIAWDVIHAHGDRATMWATLTGPWHGARVVSSPSPTLRTSAARPWVRAVNRRVDLVLDDPTVVSYRAAFASGRRKRNIA